MNFTFKENRTSIIIKATLDCLDNQSFRDFCLSYRIGFILNDTVVTAIYLFEKDIFLGASVIRNDGMFTITVKKKVIYDIVYKNKYEMYKGVWITSSDEELAEMTKKNMDLPW